MTRDDKTLLAMVIVVGFALLAWGLSILGMWIGIPSKPEVVSVAPGPATPIPSEADIIAHGLKGDASSGDVWPTETDNQIRGFEYNSTTEVITAPGFPVGEPTMTKTSLERDLKLRIVCREEKTTGKQHNMGTATAWVPCSRIDALWMDGVEVWRRERGQ